MTKLREPPKAITTTLTSKDIGGTRLIFESNGKKVIDAS
jgi:hypothetical protein